MYNVFNLRDAKIVIYMMLVLLEPMTLAII